MRAWFHLLFADWGIPEQWQLTASWGAALALIAILSWILARLFRTVVAGVIRQLTSKTQTLWDDFLFDQKFFERLGNLLLPIASIVLLVSLVSDDQIVFPIVKKLLLLSVCLSAAAFAFQIIANVERGFKAVVGSQHIPIRSYGQMAQILVVLITGIFAVSVLIDQNPTAILTGLGALTAVLLLVFKDSLLGLVASIQVNTNKLVRMGDWIEFPGQGIDGEVVDISLSVVRIRSSDNTLFSLPTYNLVSVPFKNWRNVTELGARRVKLSFGVDAYSLSIIGEGQRGRLSEAGLWKVPDETTDVTNLEAFRLWAQDYLERHGDIHPHLVRFVKLGDPTGRGIPVEMLFYTRIVGYPDWEHLHSRLLGVFLAALPSFGLRVFQERSDRVTEER